MIELTRVTIARGPEVLVRDLDLRLDPGRVFWVIGPNGAGKSSLLRVLAGLDRPERGRVTVRGSFRPRYFHSEMLLPGSASAGDWHRLAQRLVPDPGEEPGLWPRVRPGRLVRRLSTGERKRLLLDVVLQRSGALLLDEPFEHLSPDAKTRLSHRLRHRARDYVVVVATNQATGEAASEGGLHLEGGQAVPLGPGAQPQ